MTDKLQNDIKNLIKELNFNGQKKFKLIVLFGLLGDFDSFEYAINLKNFIDNHQDKNLDIFAIAIGNKNGKQKFCKFTGFQEENLIVVSDNQIHNDLKVSRGLDIGLGGWINMLLMLSGINSFKQVFGDGYLRPFELATFRLNNMKEIIQNWSDYILNEEYLPQRGASFLLNNKNQIIYKFFSNDILGYSSNMRDPLGFLLSLIHI